MYAGRAGRRITSMPSTLQQPAGTAPPSQREPLSTLRRWRHVDGEHVAEERALSGPVLVAYDGTPEAAALLRRAVAGSAGEDIVVAHCWRSPVSRHDAAVALRACVHPTARRRVLEDLRDCEADARADSQRIVQAGVALAEEAGACARGESVRLSSGRPVADALVALAGEVGAGSVVVGGRRNRGWRRLLDRWSIGRALARRLDIPVVTVPLNEAGR